MACQTGFTGPWQSEELPGSTASCAEGFLILQPTAVRNCSPMHCAGVTEKNPEGLQNVAHGERKNSPHLLSRGHDRVILNCIGETFCKQWVEITNAAI